MKDLACTELNKICKIALESNGACVTEPPQVHATLPSTEFLFYNEKQLNLLS